MVAVWNIFNGFIIIFQLSWQNMQLAYTCPLQDICIHTALPIFMLTNLDIKRKESCLVNFWPWHLIPFWLRCKMCECKIFGSCFYLWKSLIDSNRLISLLLFLVQMTSTLLHVLSLASSTDHEPLKDFLIKVSIS